MRENGFFALISRTKYIMRWGLMRQSRPENLAEHSLEVAQLAHALAVIGNKRLGKSYDLGAVALCAIYHDASEIITGDLPTPIKYYNPQLRESYKALEHTAREQLLGTLPEDLRPDYAAVFEGGTPEVRALVKAADKISALIKCIEEERAGSREFTQARAATEKALFDMKLAEAGIFLKEFLPSYEFTLDELK